MNLYEAPIHILHEKRLKEEIKTADIADSVLKRLKETEPKLHSFLSLDLEKIHDAAEKIDTKMSKGETTHPLEGMPIAIKDIFSTKGAATTCGSKFLENYHPPFESTVTRKLRDIGALFLGKTNMDEFAMGSSTENSAFGPTRNPWDLERVPGGSSGGSASSVASGQALAAIGTDTGGSIRQPASFTGIVGLKPTYGRVSRWGMIAFASSLDQAGPMTKDVQDAALILQAISGYDDKDATSLDAVVPNYLACLNKPIKGMKIGIIKDLRLEDADPEIASIFLENVKVLEEGGAEVVEVDIPNIAHAVATYYVIAPCEASSNLGRYDGVRYGHRASNVNDLMEMYVKSRDEGFGKEVKMRILIGTFALSAGYYDAYYLKAQKIQNLIRAQYRKAFEQVDVIASPVAPTPAFKIGEMIDDPIQMYLGDAFTIPANLAGIPGISIPGGFAKNKLPVGFQLLAGHLEEEKLFKAAHFFERNVNLDRPSQAV